MATVQNPARLPVRDQKGDSLRAIKDWLVRDGGHAKPEGDPDSNESVDPDRDTQFADRHRHDPLEELRNAPSIAAAPGFLIGLTPKRTRVEDNAAAANDARAAATEQWHDRELAQSNETPTEPSEIKKPVARTIAWAFLLAVAAFALAALVYEERDQKDVLAAWNQVKDWSVNEFNAAFSPKDSGMVSEGTVAVAQDDKPSSVTDKPSSPQMRQLLDGMSANWDALQGTVLGTWNRLKNWSLNEYHGAFSPKEAEANSALTNAVAQDVNGSSATDRSSYPEIRQQLDAMSANLNALQQTVVRSPATDASALSVLEHRIDTLSASLTRLQSTVSQLDTRPPALAPSRIAAKSPTADQTSPATDASALSVLERQLDTLSASLTRLQSTVSQLDTRQAQIAREIATLQSSQREMSQTLSNLPRPTRKHAPHRASSP